MNLSHSICVCLIHYIINVCQTVHAQGIASEHRIQRLFVASSEKVLSEVSQLSWAISAVFLLASILKADNLIKPKPDNLMENCWWHHGKGIMKGARS